MTPQRADNELFCDLETERFVLRRTGRLQTFLITRHWRRDPDLLEGLYLSRQPLSLLHWFFHGPRSNGRNRFAHAIIAKATGKVIGLHIVERRGAGYANCHVGVHDRDWWGKDVVVEVRARLISHFFAHGTERFGATIDAGNAPSIFNYRRLGFRVVGNATTGRRDPLTGKGRPAVRLEMLRDDWLAGPYGDLYER